MADDFEPTGRPDDLRIDVGRGVELDYWSRRLGIPRERLREAVEAAGPVLKDVIRHLGL